MNSEDVSKEIQISLIDQYYEQKTALYLDSYNTYIDELCAC